ncbi:MAG: hypothetical protein HZA48_10110 [Planctomycetes bacterium]|nr:hypothetical protein [Planctomycetota bacterium]
MLKEKTKKLACPPFSPDDILALRGKPAAKEVKKSGSFAGTVERWEYVSAGTAGKESYFFHNNRLVGWMDSGIR